MGDFNEECPNCGCEDAYHNGVCYECPDCGEEWGEESDVYDEDDEE